MSHHMTFSGGLMILLMLLGAFLMFAPSARGKRLCLGLLAASLIAVALLLGFTRSVWLASAARVLFLVCAECAMYCRFCTRKRKVGGQHMGVNDRTIAQGLDYIRRNPGIRDVILSGGDPLLLADEKLDAILAALRAIPHVEIIRIGSRTPVVLPQRITMGLIRVLRKYHPLYLNTHFNHPDEITVTAAKACARLADAGIPLGNQTVLLRGVNDDPAVLTRLMQKLLATRGRTYCVYPATRGHG
ncbi:radical SAM protein, partial [bacterium]